MTERENREAVAILVDVPKALVKSVRINVSMPADVLDAIDHYARENGLTRSGLLVKAAQREIAD